MLTCTAAAAISSNRTLCTLWWPGTKACICFGHNICTISCTVQLFCGFMIAIKTASRFISDSHPYSTQTPILPTSKYSMASTSSESHHKPMDGVLNPQSIPPSPSVIFLNLDGRLGSPAPHVPRSIISRIASTALAGVDTSSVQPPQLANRPCLLLCLLTVMACIITTCGGVLSSIIGKVLLRSLDTPGFDYHLTTAAHMGALGGVVLGVPGVAIELAVLALCANRWKRVVDSLVHFSFAAATGAVGCAILIRDTETVTIQHAVVASTVGTMVLALCDNALRRHSCDNCGGPAKS